MECSICLQNIKENSNLIYKLPCNHIFHSGCIFNWSLVNSSCPFCRKPFQYSNSISTNCIQKFGYTKDVNYISLSFLLNNLASEEIIQNNIQDIQKLIIIIDEKNRNFMDKTVFYKNKEIEYNFIGKIGILWNSNESKYLISFLFDNFIYNCVIDTKDSIAYYMKLNVNINNISNLTIEYVDH